MKRSWIKFNKWKIKGRRGGGRAYHAWNMEIRLEKLLAIRPQKSLNKSPGSPLDSILYEMGANRRNLRKEEGREVVCCTDVWSKTLPQEQP